MTIQTKDKNLLLLPIIDGGITQPFNMPGQPGYDSSKAKHNGLDLGWTKNQYSNILACQDGVVKQVIKNDVSGSRGNGVVLQHDYADGTHRWTGYIHLKNAPTLKVGDKVKQGDVIGVRGGSPYIDGKQKYGTHLHLYVTNAVKDTYTWALLLANVVNPLPFLYKSKKVTYNVLVQSFSDSLKFLEDVTEEVVSPVERDPLVNQLSESTSTLRVRLSPSLGGTIIGYLQKDKYYNYYDTATADGYTWYKIKDSSKGQWCAQTGTITIYPKKSEVEILEEEVAKLTKEVGDLIEANSKLGEEVKSLDSANKKLSTEVTTLTNNNKKLTEEKATLETEKTNLQKKNKTLTANVKTLETKITDAVTVLNG